MLIRSLMQTIPIGRAFPKWQSLYQTFTICVLRDFGLLRLTIALLRPHASSRGDELVGLPVGLAKRRE
jgi:hypothetical protein